MTLYQAMKIATELHKLNIKVEVLPEYSRRGMAEPCPALACGEDVMVEVGWAAGRLGLELEDAPRHCEELSMGVILY